MKFSAPKGGGPATHEGDVLMKLQESDFGCLTEEQQNDVQEDENGSEISDSSSENESPLFAKGGQEFWESTSQLEEFDTKKL